MSLLDWLVQARSLGRANRAASPEMPLVIRTKSCQKSGHANILATILGPCWDYFGPFWDHFGIILGEPRTISHSRNPGELPGKELSQSVFSMNSKRAVGFVLFGFGECSYVFCGID